MNKIIRVICIGISLFALTACGSRSQIEISKEPFPEFTATDFDGNAQTNELFDGYDATIVNIWSNSCGSCIEEMPELEAYYQDFKGKNVNLIAINVSAGTSDEEYQQTKQILQEKGVTFINLMVDPESSFSKEFLDHITGYPTTYIVDRDGNIAGAPLIGVVKNQEEKLFKRIELLQQ